MMNPGPMTEREIRRRIYGVPTRDSGVAVHPVSPRIDCRKVVICTDPDLLGRRMADLIEKNEQDALHVLGWSKE